MRYLLLPNKITGLNTHLRIMPGGSTMSTDTIEETDIVIGSKEWMYYTKTIGQEVPSLLPEAQKKALQTVLNLEEKNKIIPLSNILPPDELASCIFSFCMKAGILLRDESPIYFDKYFRHELKFLDELVPAYIDEDKFAAYSLEDQQGLVKTFTPDRNGFAKKVVYDHFKSPTGRLVVSDGPHILTINKKYRDMISSSYGEKGKILCVDYVSLEPAVLLNDSVNVHSNWLSSTRDTSIQNSQDIYAQVAEILFVNNLLNERITRDDAKAIVLRTIYGAQEDLIGQILQGKNSVPLHDFLFEVRELFGINNLLQCLRSERKLSNGDFIWNSYQRAIPTTGVEDYKLVNYYVQSSAVDVALLGFKQIVDSLKWHEVRPLFVLHDALFLDVHESALEVFAACVEEGKGVPNYLDQPFSLKVSVLT